MFKQEDPFQECDIVADGGPALLEWIREFTEIGESSGLRCGERHEPRHDVNRCDLCHVSHIAADQRLDVVAVPDLPTPRRRTRNGRGKPAVCNAVRKLRPKPRHFLRLEAPGKQLIQELWLEPGNLALSQRMQPQDLHPPSERVGEFGQQQNVG